MAQIGIRRRERMEISEVPIFALPDGTIIANGEVGHAIKEKEHG